MASRRRLSVVVTLSLAACASVQQPSPQTPTATQIAAFADSVVASNLSPADYVGYGLTLVEQQCAGFFTHAIEGASETSAFQQLLGLGGAAAGAAGGPVAAAVLGVVSSALGIVQSNQVGGAMPSMVYNVVKRELEAYRTASPTPATPVDAAALVEAAAEYCQSPGIANAVYGALYTAPVTATVVAPPAATPLTGHSGKVIPPRVSVGARPPVPAPLPSQRSSLRPAEVAGFDFRFPGPVFVRDAEGHLHTIDYTPNQNWIVRDN